MSNFSPSPTTKWPELKPFLEEHPFAYDIALADDEARAFSARVTRVNVIIDSDGKVIYDVHGFSSDSTDRIDAVIGSLLSEL